MINILHCSPWPLGGAVSYLAHLCTVLGNNDVSYRVVRLANRTEAQKRELGSYGVHYRNMTYADAAKMEGPWLLATAPTDGVRATECVRLVEASRGAYVFHDPNEFGMYPHWLHATFEHSKVICIRTTGLQHVPAGVHIPHPYARQHPDWQRRKLACSVARTSAVKHTDWILIANARLPASKRVDLHGAVNRLWWKYSVEPKFPGVVVPPMAGFDRTLQASPNICAQYALMVDLTIFKQDGGGTQYSLLEAMDAGTVPVMTNVWCSYDGPAKDLGFQVSNSGQLTSLLDRVDTDNVQLAEYRAHNDDYIDRVHDPKKTAAAYCNVLGVR